MSRSASSCGFEQCGAGLVHSACVQCRAPDAHAKHGNADMCSTRAFAKRWPGMLHNDFFVCKASHSASSMYLAEIRAAPLSRRSTFTSFTGPMPQNAAGPVKVRLDLAVSKLE